MINSRNDIVFEAINRCMRELYKYSQPKVTWKSFKNQCRKYSKKYLEWNRFNQAFYNKEKNSENWNIELNKHRNWENKSIKECIGPRPYEFYYLSKDKMKQICSHYEYIYRLCNKQELTDTISILKHYCKDPIVDTYIERKDEFPGHKGYKHPDNLNLEIQRIIVESGIDCNESNLADKIVSKFFEFLDMADNFYNWNSESSTFNMNIYLGASPSSNKEAVIQNWKIYRNQDIEINDITEEDDDF